MDGGLQYESTKCWMEDEMDRVVGMCCVARQAGM